MSLSTALTSLTRVARWHRRGLAAICAALAAMCAVSAVSPHPEATQTVVVAAHDLAAGARLATSDLSTRRYPVGLAPDAVLDDPGVAVGRTLSAAITSGTPLTDRAFSATSSLASPGQQLVGFHVPDSSVLALVHVGDVVSVVATTGSGGQDTSVVTLAHQVRVAALPQASDQGGLVSTGSSNGALVVVSCDPKTAATLAAWASSSQLGITLG